MSYHLLVIQQQTLDSRNPDNVTPEALIAGLCTVTAAIDASRSSSCSTAERLAKAQSLCAAHRLCQLGSRMTVGSVPQTHMSSMRMAEPGLHDPISSLRLASSNLWSAWVMSRTDWRARFEGV
jgi:hypothetical protein